MTSSVESALRPFEHKPIEPFARPSVNDWPVKESEAKTDTEKAALAMIDNIIYRGKTTAENPDDQKERYQTLEAKDASYTVSLDAAEQAQITAIKKIIDEKQQGGEPYKYVSLASKVNPNRYLDFRVSLFVRDDKEITVVWTYLEQST